MKKIQDKNYVSSLDKFLEEFDQQHPELSKSQQREIAKHQRIFELRDQVQAEKEGEGIWSGF